MRNITIILLSLLGGCATPGDIYASEVDASATSPKPLAEVSQCIQLRWAEAPITAPGGKLTFPNKNGFGQVLGLLTLTPVEAGTLVEFRKTGQLMLGANDWKKCL